MHSGAGRRRRAAGVIVGGLAISVVCLCFLPLAEIRSRLRARCGACARSCYGLYSDDAAAKAEGRPYTVAFVGVNGVGKSTSPSKVAYYLKTNGFTPMPCACDTFRAGAVEAPATDELPLPPSCCFLYGLDGVYGWPAALASAHSLFSAATSEGAAEAAAEEEGAAPSFFFACFRCHDVSRFAFLLALLFCGVATAGVASWTA